MGRMKINCDNTLCLYHMKNNNCQLPTVHLKHMECSNFKPSLNYYVIEFLNAFRETSLITEQSWDKDVRIGAYFAMHIYGISFAKCKHGNWEWLQFYKNDDPEKQALKASEIVNLPVDEENMSSSIINW